MIWSTIIGFVGGPVIKGPDRCLQREAEGRYTSEKIAADLAAGEIAAQTTEIRAQTEYKIASLGHWYEPDKIMGYCVAVYTQSC